VSNLRSGTTDRLRLPSALTVSLGLLLLLGASFAAAADGRMDAHSASSLPTKIYVQGDSLTVDSSTVFKSLAKPSIVTLDAKSGRHAYEGIARMRKVKSFPAAVVVALGTNDDYNAYGISLFKSHIQAAMGLFGTKRCVVWVNLFQARTAKQIKAKVPMIFTGMNALLASIESRTPTFHVVNWAKMSGSHPEWYRYDSVHPTNAGYLARAKATIAALKTCGTPSGGGVTPVGSPDGGGGSPGPY